MHEPVDHKISITKNVLSHLSDFNRRANHVGDARQRAMLTTLWVWDHPAITTLQWNLAKLYPLSTGYTWLGLNDLQQDIRMDACEDCGSTATYYIHPWLDRIIPQQCSQKKQHPYGFGDKLMQADTSLSLWCTGLHFHFSFRDARRLEDIQRLDRFRIQFHGSWIWLTKKINKCVALANYEKILSECSHYIFI